MDCGAWWTRFVRGRAARAQVRVLHVAPVTQKDLRYLRINNIIPLFELYSKHSAYQIVVLD